MYDSKKLEMKNCVSVISLYSPAQLQLSLEINFQVVCCVIIIAFVNF